MALAFGTSGIRGLATEFTASECSWLVQAFVEHLKRLGTRHDHILLAGDFRASTPEILGYLQAALETAGCQSTFCGIVPTPTLAYACIERKLPGIMVTGSHIPADRNGIKFYFANGEILKKDEASIFTLYQGLKTAGKSPARPTAKLPEPDPRAKSAFIDRYVGLFAPGALKGLNVLFYEHSTAAKEVLPQILRALGAEVTHFGATREFTPVDTEAVDNADQLKAEILKARADVLVSADGDGDRPMVVAENGELIPGDLIGLLAARSLGAREIVVPVSCNTALEASKTFEHVHRTRIGSPFVLEKMIEVQATGTKVAGFEANGGFFFEPLLTRDCIFPILLLLAEVKKSGKSLSRLLESLPPRFTHSGLVRNTPVERSRAILAQAERTPAGQPLAPALARFGNVKSLDTTDGARFTLDTGAIIHLRPSGNAPEFRVYAESASKAAARELCEAGLGWVRALA